VNFTWGSEFAAAIEVMWLIPSWRAAPAKWTTKRALFLYVIHCRPLSLAFTPPLPPYQVPWCRVTQQWISEH
jgi:hypothetical protein